MNSQKLKRKILGEKYENSNRNRYRATTRQRNSTRVNRVAQRIIK